MIIVHTLWGIAPLFSNENHKSIIPEKTTGEKAGVADAEPVRGINESGRKILLYPNGTWKFAPAEKDAKEEKNVHINAPTNGTVFHTPSAANEFLQGKVADYKIFYNKNKWDILSENLNDMTEYSLLHRKKNAFVIVLPETASVPLNTLREIVLDNARRASPKMSILSEEMRTVNNAKILMLNLKADVENTSFIYVYYIYSGDNKSVQIIGFTTEELYSQYKQDMEDFLNGFMAGKPASTGKISPQKEAGDAPDEQ